MGQLLGRLQKIGIPREELEQAAEYFKSIDEEVSSIFYKIADIYGLTDEVFKKIMNEMLVESKSDL
ncbi:MAG: hypothetical protein ACJAR6_000501 [Oleispira sp.]|jgi:hypothetical protein